MTLLLSLVIRARLWRSSSLFRRDRRGDIGTGYAFSYEQLRWSQIDVPDVHLPSSVGWTTQGVVTPVFDLATAAVLAGPFFHGCSRGRMGAQLAYSGTHSATHSGADRRPFERYLAPQERILNAGRDR